MNHSTDVMYSSSSITQARANFMSGVYRWMSIGVLITATISYMVASSPEMVELFLGNAFLFYGCIILQFASVIYLGVRLQKMAASTATAVYLAYSALTGLTLSTIFLIYTGESIMQVFLVTAGAFGGLSLFGYITKRDLGPVGTFCHMGLWGIVIIAIISLFAPSIMGGMVGQIYSGVGVIVFAGLAAYDTQMIKQSFVMNEHADVAHKKTIFGALKLYLDFINLFLMLLRLIGGRRN